MLQSESNEQVQPAGGVAADARSAGVRLPFQPPYNWARMLAFFALRATPGVEAVAGDCYLRTVSFDGEHGVLEVSPGENKAFLKATLHGAHKADLAAAGRRLREMFDVDAPGAGIDAALARDSVLHPLIQRNPGIRVPGAWDGFELTVRAILGQQVSVKAATTLAGRISARYGEPLGFAGDNRTLTRVFPGPERLRRARFNDIGIVRSRAGTIRRVAGAVAAGEVSFDSVQDPEEFRRALCKIKGVGDWTAQYVAMRVLKHPDAFPSTDLGLLKSLAHPGRASAAELLRRAEAWRPWRAYAAMLLWSASGGAGG